MLDFNYCKTINICIHITSEERLPYIPQQKNIDTLLSENRRLWKPYGDYKIRAGIPNPGDLIYAKL
jgi:hypothetical protein